MYWVSQTPVRMTQLAGPIGLYKLVKVELLLLLVFLVYF